MKTLLFLSAVALTGLVLIAVMILRPVPIPAEKDCLIQEGVVTSIDEGGIKDVVFTLMECSTKFYINRGLERGLQLTDLRTRLTGKKIVVKYPAYRTPLGNTFKHLSKVQLDNEVIFTELTDQ